MTERDASDAYETGYDAGVRSCDIEIAELRAELGSALAEINRLLLAAAALEQALQAAAMWEQRANGLEHERDTLLAACEAAAGLIETLDRESGFRSFMMPLVLSSLQKAIANARKETAP